MMGRPVASFKMFDLQRERAHLAEAEQDIVDVEIQISFLHLEIGHAESVDAPSGEAKLKLSRLLTLVTRLRRERSFLLGSMRRSSGE